MINELENGPYVAGLFTEADLVDKLLVKASSKVIWNLSATPISSGEAICKMLFA